MTVPSRASICWIRNKDECSYSHQDFAIVHSSQITPCYYQLVDFTLSPTKSLVQEDLLFCHNSFFVSFVFSDCFPADFSTYWVYNMSQVIGGWSALNLLPTRSWARLSPISRISKFKYIGLPSCVEFCWLTWQSVMSTLQPH